MVTQPEAATYTLKASEIEVVKESAGSKFARCMFAYCAGIEDKGSVSIQLIEGSVDSLVLLRQQGTRPEEQAGTGRGNRETSEGRVLPERVGDANRGTSGRR